jgi:uncharacterized protein (DUF1786 family)
MLDSGMYSNEDRVKKGRGETLKILAIDIGAGTQDILLYDSNKRLANCIKLVLPSPSPLYAAKVAEATLSGSDIFFTGRVIGGGSLSRAVKRHLQKGFRVYMQPASAYCLRNNLEDVRSIGVVITDGPPPGFRGALLELDELDLTPLATLLETVGESLENLEAAGVAVQDHGIYRSGESNRKTRLRYMRELLSKDAHPWSLSFGKEEVPEHLPRMRSAIGRLREQLSCEHLLVMDTSPAAIVGCLTDQRVEECLGGNLLVINAGNGHTLACLLKTGRVVALLEHHTKHLEATSFSAYLRAFCNGEARDDDSYMAKGHGLFYLEDPPGFDLIDLIAVTGPNRELLEGSGMDIYYPSPGGDMMMTGPLGVVNSLKRKLLQKNMEHSQG